MRVKPYVLTLALLCGAAARAQAQAPAQTPAQTPAAAAPARAEEKLPAADEVFDKYLAALGGEAALGKLKTRVARGSVELAPMGVTGTSELSQKAPQMVVTTMTLPGLGVLQQGYDGTVGWAKDPFMGLREMKGGELFAVQRAAHLNPAGWRKSYKSLKTTGRAKVGDREVYVVEGGHAGDTPDKLYFDTQTGLLLRLDTVVDSPQGRVLSESTLEDYRDVDGIKMPFTSRTVMGPVSVIVRIQEVKHDVPVEDKIFAKPAS